MTTIDAFCVSNRGTDLSCPVAAAAKTRGAVASGDPCRKVTRSPKTPNREYVPIAIFIILLSERNLEFKL
jgi:hypothetical protein